MAMGSQQLMAAMLCVASSHRLSVGLEQTEVNVFKLHAVSARLLQGAICCATRPEVLVMALATSLVLCLSNIVSSSSHSQEWGVHLKGTSALIKRLDESRYKFEKSTRVLLRFYTSLTAIAASRVQSDGGMQDYIDDLAGFSTSLKPIIDAMQTLDRSHGRTEAGSTDTHSHHGPSATESYLDLVTKVNAMIQLRTLQFRPEITDSLSDATKLDFWLLDEAYHHMVLLQLYNRMDCADISLQYSIGFSVKRIISCIGSMEIVARPCPGVATLPPLFEAGCSAIAAEDRTEIARLLEHIRTCFGMGNVACTTEFLWNRWGIPANHNRTQERKTVTAAFLPY
ncbi:unnamed protein product [Clonostachys byssicola]|uniref:Uncharacterized protein n=1 Tax=Clonostachys byssicola TaxID=160290 RepID=A0A9N9Y124_9HYPO|nr:unnamed protein product [Clonostachys byssicola]